MAMASCLYRNEIDVDSFVPPQSVRFADKIVIYSTTVTLYSPNKKNTPLTTRSDCHRQWYSTAECDEMKANALKWLRRGKKGGHFQNSAMFTARGFEYVVNKYPRDQIRRDHVKRVVGHQHKEQVEGLPVADFAARSSIANGSPKRCLQLALSDQMEARKIHQESPKISMRVSPSNKKNDERTVPLEGLSKGLRHGKRVGVVSC